MAISYYRVTCNGREVLSRCSYSPSWRFRMKGLLGRDHLAEDEGLWLKPCCSIHMFFMKFPIDVIFLNRENHVIRIFSSLKPWQVTPVVWKAHSVLEIQANLARKFPLHKGDTLHFEET